MELSAWTNALLWKLPVIGFTFDSYKDKSVLQKQYVKTYLNSIGVKGYWKNRPPRVSISGGHYEFLSFTPITAEQIWEKLPAKGRLYWGANTYEMWDIIKFQGNTDWFDYLEGTPTFHIEIDKEGKIWRSEQPVIEVDSDDLIESFENWGDKIN